MTSAKIQQTPTGQYTITIPRQIATAMGVTRGNKATWKITGLKKIELSL